MARPKYKMKSGDVIFARDYLLNALENPDYDVGKPGRSDFRHYLERTQDDDLDHEAMILNRWCQSCLVSEQWGLLKLSIRKRRYQEKNKGINVTLTIKAHKVLLAVKKKGKGETLSDAILWLSMQAGA